MCLTCGCMDAHKVMSDADITYEDLRRAADANQRSVADVIDVMTRTEAKDRDAHPHEYARAGATTEVASR